MNYKINFYYGDIKAPKVPQKLFILQKNSIFSVKLRVEIHKYHKIVESISLLISGFFLFLIVKQSL